MLSAKFGARAMLFCASACALLGLGQAASAAEPLATAAVEYRKVAQTYAAEGVVEAVKQSTVAAQIAGRIVQINFDVGDYVEKGAVILRIDEREAAQALSGTRAQVAQAQANLAQARAAYERTKTLVTQKFVSQAALDKAQADYKAAQAQVEATLAGAGQAETVKGFTAVTAPYSGVVSARLVELGEMAAPGKPLMSGFDPHELRVVASIPQYMLGRIHSGAPARVEIPSLSRWIEAKEVVVLPVSDPRSLSTRVRLTLPENLRDVFPGVFARAHFVIGEAERLVVPASAVLQRSEVTGAFVVAADGAIRLRQIRLGEFAGPDGYEVLAGLAAGDRVALDPVAAGLALKRQAH
ncbi:MAG: efflux RND transporter periplasmic adaptor subunit [Rhodocyclaceae bacterium]|nr:efflux RND transporter periplasmic adaptor subunit [Rhodocyclaceae bacterium]MBX3668853.1 efflux RND transporter periplasmic adaptor subunit [Rhodocyclaceae bacterium]